MARITRKAAAQVTRSLAETPKNGRLSGLRRGDRLQGTLSLIGESKAAEDERRKREILRAKAQEQLERSALEAAIRERDQAQAHARRSRRLSLVALSTMILALVLAGVALALYLQAR